MESNKHEYVVLAAKYHLVDHYLPYLEAFLQGFSDVIPLAALTPLTPLELRRWMAGSTSIDLRDWKKNTLYEGCFSKSHRTVQWFWECMEELSNEELCTVRML